MPQLVDPDDVPLACWDRPGGTLRGRGEWRPIGKVVSGLSGILLSRSSRTKLIISLSVLILGVVDL